MIFTPAHLKNPYVLIATGLGSGLLPKAPGTWGSLLALAAWSGLAGLSLPVQIGATVSCFLLGCWTVQKVIDRFEVGDAGAIVIDEIAGMWLTLWMVPVGGWMVVGFVLFRVFDILKPWPVSWLDRHVHGGLGVMADDIAAAVYAAIVLQLSIFAFERWFAPALA
ncbi:MAG: phosphatidylglycerophosphatase A [Proteobacteria bacterium]|nr:phosphatidylglycerophosphatase A [Pseudomonadota bacterium]